MASEKTFFLKNMLCSCCLVLLRERLERANIKIKSIKLGELNILVNNPKDISRTKTICSVLGFDLIKNHDEIIVEKIKTSVIELIHHLNNSDSIIRKSDYLVEKMGMSYQQISKTFSHHESITLEKYIILQKTEKIKELIDSNEYTLSEIAYMMDYSSVQHLSNQFKKICGLTPSQYKKSDKSLRKPIDKLY